MKDAPTQRALVFGWFLLAVSLPLGMTLEALHALKVPVYLESSLRRELWTLAHAHGTLLGILCIAFAAVGERTLSDERARARVSRWLRAGAALLPIGFFGGGVLNTEGDPSYAILLVPLGAACLLVALFGAALAARAPDRG